MTKQERQAYNRGWEAAIEAATKISREFAKQCDSERRRYKREGHHEMAVGRSFQEKAALKIAEDIRSIAPPI